MDAIRRDQIRVAVAEDDHGMRRAVADTLREQGLEVVEAVDGATLLSAIRRGGITLAITDLLMPGLAGSDVIGLCRVTGVHVPFIVVTGAPDVITTAVVGAPGVIVLRKPVAIDALLAAVAQAIGMAFTPPDSPPPDSISE
ncbi:MAG TPA: response regulator [Kofleriaceae bacterium]|jgi:DNA-binding NtrC family response regulator|nr:response regulator [Kofleriaceae bacterium]